jgi:hypothetical protein
MYYCSRCGAVRLRGSTHGPTVCDSEVSHYELIGPKRSWVPERLYQLMSHWRPLVAEQPFRWILHKEHRWGRPPF